MRTPSKLLVPALALSAILISVGHRQMYGRGTACLAPTVNGPVQGTLAVSGASCAFLGIPFAASTANQNRWKPPQPPAPWTNILSTTTPPANCASLSGAGAPQGSEDCLKLNLWVRNPRPTAAPVIVWIHTGSFVAASANFGGSNGQRLAAETGVIVVEANYRLAAFGFLSHRALEQEDPHRSAGNYGLLDQRAALQWVRDNIAGFGGDPDNVTLAGTSAGGQSVGLHMVSPGSRGLFHRAIVESAYPTTAWRTRDDGVAQGEALAATLGCTNPAQVASCLRSKTPSQILLAFPQASPQVVEPIGQAVWEPVVDGIVIPDQPRRLFEQGEFAHVPTIIGTDRDEAWGPFITRSFPSVTLAQYEAWVKTEFGTLAPRVLAAYPASDFASPQEAMSRLVTDGQFVCESRRLGDLIADGGLRGRGPHPEHDTGKRIKMPVYMYSYDYVLNDLSVGHVIHGLESNIIFGNNYTMPANHVLTAADFALHDIMAGYWTTFANTGDPNGGGLPTWLEYRKNHDNYLVFDSVLSAGDDQRSDACEFWSPFSLKSMLGGVTAASP